jgi:EpsI family protein
MDNKTKMVTSGLFIPVALILLAQTAAPRFLAIREGDFAPPELQKIPYQMGKWQAHGDQTLDRGVTEYLRPDEYMLRDYADTSTGRTIGLFVAYFKSLQNTMGPHSPSVCLPGAGWLTQSYSQTSVALPGSTKNIPVNQFVMEKAGEHILVLYWYQNNRRVWAAESEGQFRVLKDMLTYRRSDTSLVRLITPLRGLAVQDELDQTLDFARTIFPVLEQRFAATN